MRRLNLGSATGVLAAGCLGLLSVAGCSGDEQSSDPSSSPEATVTVTQTPASPTESTSQEPTPDEKSSQPPSSAEVPEEARALLAAGRTGLQQVPNSTVYAIEHENDGDLWEVEVVTGDGTKHEMYISRNGNEVVQAPRNDGREAKYRERVGGAQLDFEAAVEAILGEVPAAVFEELNLDDEKGTIVWEADVIDGSGIARDVAIDASTGKVLKNQPDN